MTQYDFPSWQPFLVHTGKNKSSHDYVPIRYDGK